MNADMIMKYNVDLNVPLVPRMANTLFVSGDNMANTIEAVLTKDGKALDASGYTCVLKMTRPDGEVPEMAGQVDGNVLTVTMTSDFYAVPGHYTAKLKLINAQTGERKTVLVLYGEILDDGGMPTIIPGNKLPEDIEAMLAMMEELREATADSRVAAQEARDAGNQAVAIAQEAAEKANQAAENIDEKVAEANAELAGKVGQLSEEIDAFREATLSCEIVNRFDKNAITEGYIAESGNFVSNSSWRCTDFIPCNAEILYFTCNDNGTRKPWGMSYVASYDAAKNLVSHVNTISDGVYTGTNENGFVRFAYKENDARTDYMLSADASYEYVEHKVDYKIKGSALPAEIARNGSNVLYGKKYTACGDSYTAGAFDGSPDTSYLDENGVLKTYHYFIGKRNAMEVLNHGVSGSIMALNKDYVAGTITNPNMDQPFAHQRYMEVPLDSDYITLAFGINDASRTNLGTIDDTTNETFYGAWNVVLDYFLQNAPFAKIGIIIYTPNRDYHDAILAIAKKWGKKVLDFSGEDSGLPWFMPERIGMPAEINAKYKELYRVSDTNRTHPSWQAHEYESTIIEDFLRSL